MARAPELLSIPKNQLMLLAGLVWCVAGFFVMSVGFPLLVGAGAWWLYLLALVVFVVFYQFVFSALVVRHSGRVRASPSARMPFWQFFDAKSYVVMAVMMAGGAGLRLSHLAPDWFIAFFYSGLGLALFACGVRFLSVFGRRVVLAEMPGDASPTG